MVEGRIIFRCDDVNPNTDLVELGKMYSYITENFDSEFWSVVSLFGRESGEGSVYPGVPFKDKDNGFFYDVNSFISKACYYGKVVSHGLLHADHSRLQFDAQEMSIVASCRYLGTDVFVPPFNRYNSSTESVCNMNGIRLVKYTEGWRCLDHEKFDPNHKLWYFHPWRFNLKTLMEKLSLAQLQGR